MQHQPLRASPSFSQTPTPSNKQTEPQLNFPNASLLQPVIPSALRVGGLATSQQQFSSSAVRQNQPESSVRYTPMPGCLALPWSPGPCSLEGVLDIASGGRGGWKALCLQNSALSPRSPMAFPFFCSSSLTSSAFKITDYPLKISPLCFSVFCLPSCLQSLPCLPSSPSFSSPWRLSHLFDRIPCDFNPQDSLLAVLQYLTIIILSPLASLLLSLYINHLNYFCGFNY